MKYTIRDENDTDVEYLLKYVECLEENQGDLEYKLMQAHDKIDALETYTKNCIDILTNGLSEINGLILSFAKIMCDSAERNSKILNNSPITDKK